MTALICNVTTLDIELKSALHIVTESTFTGMKPVQTDRINP